MSETSIPPPPVVVRPTKQVSEALLNEKVRLFSNPPAAPSPVDKTIADDPSPVGPLPLLPPHPLLPRPLLRRRLLRPPLQASRVARLRRPRLRRRSRLRGVQFELYPHGEECCEGVRRVGRAGGLLM